jgi:tetratricopeptide (TPR) repeat protein
MQNQSYPIDAQQPHARVNVLSVAGVTPRVSKRLEYLLKLTSRQDAAEVDPFAWYGLAMEYRGLERYDEAFATFERLRSCAPEYVPMYLMCGQMLEKLGRGTDARSWLRAGIEAARQKGDAHALSELESALEALE